MKQFIADFIRRGMTAGGFGPVVLAVLYLILQRQGMIDTLTVSQVSTGIFSITALAFVAGGMNVIYQVEQLPLMVAILIHGSILYAAYLAVYLINGWLKWGTSPVLVFTGIFVLGYFLIWMVIYSIVKRRTTRINEILEEKRRIS